GHGSVPSIRSAAVVSAEARAPVVRGREAQEELCAHAIVFGAQEEPGARRRAGCHMRLAGDTPLLRIAIGVLYQQGGSCSECMKQARTCFRLHRAPAAVRGPAWLAHTSGV